MQRLRYLAGRPLPKQMRPWVLHDLTGRGNYLRYLLRGLLLFAPVYIAFLLFPGRLDVRLIMVLLVLTPVVFMQVALRDVYRRHLLVSNGIDDSAVDVARLTRDVRARDAWERRPQRRRPR